MSANPIDLTTVAAVKAYLGIPANATADDAVLQGLITSVSQYWITRTQRSELSSVQSFNERYNGNGKDTLQLRHWPIVSVTALTVGGLPVPQSADYIDPGWVLNERATALVIIGAGTYGKGFYGISFEYGRLNINVQYTAGFEEVPFDVQDAVNQHVAIKYKRRNTLDQESITIPSSGGTTRYRDWEVPPEIERVINAYRRWWP